MSTDAVENGTRDRLVASYNSVMGRSSATNVAGRERTSRALRRSLSPWLPARRDISILDVGCGEGTLLSALREDGYERLSGFDLSPENVEICHQYGHFFVRQFDAMNVHEFAGSDAFDLVLAIDILEHLPKDSALLFLERIRRVLRPGGTVVIQTPNMGSLFASFYRHGDLSHEFGLTERTLAHLFVMAGFRHPNVFVAPSWNATTLIGRLRELYLILLHRAVFLADDSSRATIASKNLLGIAVRPED